MDRLLDIKSSEVNTLYEFVRVLAFDPKFKNVRELPQFTDAASIVNRLMSHAK